MDTASAVFSSTVQQKKEKSTEELISTLYKKIGILEVERDFIKKIVEAGSSVATLRLCVEPKHAALSIIQ